MLDRKSTRLLKALYRSGRLPKEKIHKITGHQNERYIDPVVQFLMRQELITICYISEASDTGEPYTDGYEITIEGRAYIEQSRRSFWGFFLPYAITTLIAFSSLIVSIINVLS